METSNSNIAFFITPHGYGHAARAAAIMQSVVNTIPNAYFHIFTQAPEWIFDESIPNRYVYKKFYTDVGFIQTSPFEENISATIHKLKQFYPVPNSLVNLIADELIRNKIILVICDIAPIGIIAAQKAKLPSILIENFTWSWIYKSYLSENYEFMTFIQLLSDYSNRATYHIQVEPVCEKSQTCALSTNPVSRKHRTDRQFLRDHIGIKPQEIMVLLSVGNMDDEFLKNIVVDDPFKIVIPSTDSSHCSSSRIIPLANELKYYHPDLINASDIVISKVGYSTLAEIFFSNSRYLYIPRCKFPESIPLIDYINHHMTGEEVTLTDLFSPTWQQKAFDLLKQSVDNHQHIQNGADQITGFLIKNKLIY